VTQADQKSGLSMVSRWLALGVVAFWAGAAVMAFELAGARLLMPAFGMGVEVWAVVIAASLGALAIGYAVGGKVIDVTPSHAAPAVVLLVASLSLLLVRITAPRVIRAFGEMSLTGGAFCSAAVVLGAPMLLLGTVPPMLARLLLAGTGRTGTVVGGLMAAGTTGGVVGTILTGLVLIPRLGISATLLVLAVGSAACSVVVVCAARPCKAKRLLTITAVAISSGGTFLKCKPAAAGPMRVLAEVEGLYGHLEVLEHNGKRALLCNGIFHTLMPVSGLGMTRGTLIRGRDYVELIPYFRPGCRSALLIGVAGGLHEQALALHGITTHGVELEPAIVPLAAEYFGLAGKVTVGDARRFLLGNSERFDAIILDAFIGGSIPDHLFTMEAFRLMRAHLEAKGLLVVHLISTPTHLSTRAVARTLRSVFPQLTAVRTGFADQLQHVYLFASGTALELGDGEHLELRDYGFTDDQFCQIDTRNAPLLTDDKSPLALLSRDIVAEHRKRSLQLRRNPQW